MYAKTKTNLMFVCVFVFFFIIVEILSWIEFVCV